MSSSVVTSNTTDIINSTQCNENSSVIMNFQNTNTNNENTIDITITSSEAPSTLPTQTQNAHIAPKQVVPVVYIQTPSKLNSPFIPVNKNHTNNIVVNSVAPLQLPTMPEKNSTITIPTPNTSVIFGNSLKAQQLVIQKPTGSMQTLPVLPVPVSSSYGSKITGAYLTMLKPVPKNSDNSNLVTNRVQVATLNKINPAENFHILNSASLASAGITMQNHKYVIAPMPQVTTNRLPVTATTSSVQSKIALMPVTIPKPLNNMNNKPKVFNFKISDGQIQNENDSIITVMCDSSKQEQRNVEQVTPENHQENSNKLTCDEVINLESPESKEGDTDKSYELSIIEDSTGIQNNFTISIQDQPKKDIPKFPKHGISILKKYSSFSEQRRTEKQNSLIISPVPNAITTISDVNTKEVKISTSLDFEEEPVVIPESKVVPQKTERRRKSNFSYRKDYDDVQITSSDWNDKKTDLERFEGTDITLTQLEESEKGFKKEMKSTSEELIEIEIIKDNGDINMNNDNSDVSKILKWDDGIGTLPGSDLTFQMNEFGFLEFVTKDEYKNILCKRIAKAKERGNKPLKDETQEEVRCLNCGCYGMVSDFINTKYCSYDCQESGNKNIKEKETKIKKKKKKLFKKNGESPSDMKNEREDTPSDDDNTSNENSQDKFSYPWTCTKKGFSWAKYLDHIKAKSAPVKLFKDPFPYNRNCFRPGMKLEGVDPQHPSYFCVLTVAEVNGYRIRLHFDGYPENYDFWLNADSMDIFPAGWCEKYGHVLHPPPNYTIEGFNWNNYLKHTKSTAAPKHLFANRAGNVSYNYFTFVY